MYSVRSTLTPCTTGILLVALLATGLATLGTAWAAGPASAPPDAVIEVWEQHWTLAPDGTTGYHERQHVRLNNDRTYGEFADPRITYNVDTDELEIINARVQRPDGTYCELPDYSHVAAAPDSSAGWPAFGNIHQHVLVMSGIETGCVVELEYRLSTKPGARRYLAADVRLDHRYPVKRRVVAVTTPANVPVSTAFSLRPQELGDRDTSPQVETTAAGVTHTWTFTNLAAVPPEPNSPTRWGAHFSFSTAGPVDDWLRSTLDRIDAAAVESDLIAKLAADWTRDSLSAPDKLRAIQEKLAATFNFVDFDPTWLRGNLRMASETLRSGHGSPEEAAALFLSLARAAGLPTRLGVLINAETWNDKTPQSSLVSAYVVLLDADDQPGIWDAHRGRILRDDHWAGHTLLTFAAGGQFSPTPLPAWSDPDESRCRLTGNLTIHDDGTFTGDVSLLTTGLFVSPEELRSNDAQKRRLTALVHRVLPDAKIDSFNVTKLADNEFAVEADVTADEPLKKLSGAFRLELAQDGPFAANVSLPLAYAQRRNPVALGGAFDEQIELTVTWPEAWRIDAQPLEISAVTGDWGRVAQQITLADNRLTLRRHVRLAQRELAPDSLLELRQPLNELRTDAARTLILHP